MPELLGGNKYIKDYLEQCLDMNKAESIKMMLLLQTMNITDYNIYQAHDTNLGYGRNR